jgi:hypothetical protein
VAMTVMYTAFFIRADDSRMCASPQVLVKIQLES